MECNTVVTLQFEGLTPAPAAAEEAAPAAAEEATATLSEVEEASLAPAADQAATTERTAPAPCSCRRCSQPCRGYDGPTGDRCRHVSLPGPPTPERVRASSHLHVSLLPTPVREEEARERETDSSSLALSPLLSLPKLYPICPPDKMASPPYPSLSGTSTNPVEPQALLSPSTFLSQPQPLPLSPGQYTCKKCSKKCKETDIQPLGCTLEDSYGDLVIHPALVKVWPICCSDCWMALWNLHMR